MQSHAQTTTTACADYISYIHRLHEHDIISIYRPHAIACMDYIANMHKLQTLHAQTTWLAYTDYIQLHAQTTC